MEERGIMKQEELNRVGNWRAEQRKECGKGNCPSLCLLL